MKYDKHIVHVVQSWSIVWEFYCRCGRASLNGLQTTLWWTMVKRVWRSSGLHSVASMMSMKHRLSLTSPKTCWQFDTELEEMHLLHNVSSPITVDIFLNASHKSNGSLLYYPQFSLDYWTMQQSLSQALYHPQFEHELLKHTIPHTFIAI